MAKSKRQRRREKKSDGWRVVEIDLSPMSLTLNLKKEELKLPNYLQFLVDEYFSFKVSEELYVELNHRFGTLYLMWGDNDSVFDYSEEWELTRENYYKVCEICEKIYNGEMEFSELLSRGT